MAKYKKEIRDQALAMYATGSKIIDICRELNISNTAIYAWMEKYDWKTKTQKIEENAQGRYEDSVAKMKLRQRKLMDKTLEAYEKDLKKNKVRVKPTDAVISMKHNLHLVGEAETSVRLDIEGMDEHIGVVLKDEGKVQPIKKPD